MTEQATGAEGGSHGLMRLLGAVLAIGGVVALILGVMEWKRAVASETWPRATGRIVHAKVITHGHSIERHTYEAEVRYVFTVADREHSGSRIRFTSRNTTKAAAEALAAKYPAGASVAVAYDPADPGTCALEPGLDPSGGRLLTAGPFCVIAGLLLFFVAPRLRERPKG